MPAPRTEQVDVQALLERAPRRAPLGGERLPAQHACPRAVRGRAVLGRDRREAAPRERARALLQARPSARLMRWYVEPLAQQQRSFNDATLKLIDALFEELDRVSADRDTRRQADRRARGAGFCGSSAASDRLRADRRRTARRRGASRLLRLRDPHARLDRARARASAPLRRRPARRTRPCSTSAVAAASFVALLRDAGVDARGVDADGDMVAYARGEGLDVEQADAARAPRGATGRAPRRDLRGPGRRAPAARRARALPRARAREAPPAAACSSPRRSTRSPRSRFATTSPI